MAPDEADKGRLTVLERWRDAEASTRHLKTHHLKALKLEHPEPDQRIEIDILPIVVNIYYMSHFDIQSRRKDEIVKLACSMFVRYGFARTTMADVAQQSKISRPTLYASFPNKEDLFEAVIDRIVSEKISSLTHEIDAFPDLETRLRHACLSWAREGYDLVQANPDARDLFDLDFAAVRESHRRFASFLEGVLGEGGVDDPQLTAQTIVAALRGIKSLAEDRQHLERMIVRICAAFGDTRAQ